MQAKPRPLALSFGLALAAACDGVTLAQTAPTRQKIAEGAWARSVNNTAVSLLSPNSPAGNTIMALWQQHDVIPQGAFEKPMHLYRANGTYTWSEATGGVLTWSVPLLPIPKPNQYQYTADPSVVMTEDTPDWRFVAGGSALPSTGTDEVSYVIASDTGETNFDQADAFDFDDSEAVHPRLGVFHNGLGQSDLDTVHLLALNTDASAGELGQVFLRWSQDSGETWEPSLEVDEWEPVEVNESPAIGYPSAPVLLTIGSESDLHSIFAWANDNATLLSTGYRNVEDDTAGNFDFAEFDVNPNLVVGSGQTYYERSNLAIAPFM